MERERDRAEQAALPVLDDEQIKTLVAENDRLRKELKDARDSRLGKVARKET